MTSSAKTPLRSACSIAAPPYLMTTVLPRNSRIYGSASMMISARRASVIGSQDVAGQVLVPHDVAEPPLHQRAVHRQLLARHLGSVERHILQELLHDRVEAPGANVLGRRVHAHGRLRHGLDGIL